MSVQRRMDEWTDRWTDEWTDALIDGGRGELMDSRYVDGRDIHSNGHKDRRTDG